MKTIRIDRKRWIKYARYERRGNKNCGCALGFAIHQVAKCAWSEVNGYKVTGSKLQTLRENNVTGINDYENDPEREEKLKTVFEKCGFKLEFYN